MAETPTLQRDVFISYSQQDSAFAARLRERLIDANLTVWQDVTDIRAGDRIWNQLDEGLRASKTVVAIISKAALASDWVNEELAMRRLQSAEDRSYRLIPVVISDLEERDLPLRLRTLAWVDFRRLDLSDPAAWKDKAEALVNQIRGALPAAQTVLGVPFVVIAMTTQELEALWDDEELSRIATANPLDRERVKRLREEWRAQSSGIEIRSCYGDRREDWRPAGCGDTSVRSVVQEIAERYNHLVNDSGETPIHPQFFSNDFFDPDAEWRLRTWSYLNETGCMVIADAISLFHPELNARFVQSGLGAVDQSSIMIVPPYGASVLPLHQLLEREIRILTELAFHRFDNLDPRCEFGGADLRALRRALLSMLPEASRTVAARRPSPARQAAWRNKLPGVRKNGVQESWERFR